MSIVKLSEQHIKALVDFRSIASKESEYVNALSLHAAEDIVKDTISSDTKLGFVAIKNNRVVGQLFLKRNSVLGIMHILSIAILEEYYNTGLATELLDLAIKEAKSNKLMLVELIVHKANARAISFYKRKGFVCVSTYGKNNLKYVKNVLAAPLYHKW